MKNKSQRKTLKATVEVFINKATGKFEPLVTQETLKKIEDDLRNRYATKIIAARKNQKIKDRLIAIITTDYKHLLSTSKETRKKQASYIVTAIVGTGIIEMLINANQAITDIGFNGADLTIETNDEKIRVPGALLGIDEQYIDKTIQKYARANNKEFNETLPILDGMIGNVRISAIHEVLSPSGATLSLRISRPALALNKDNFQNFAPLYILELLEKIVKTNANIFISGETGSGKTELQKLLLSFIDAREKIVLIEDVQETHAKALFPKKDVLSWITGKNIGISDLTKAALRNNPKWIIVSESRGKEAYEMLQAILSGHNIISTLHATDALAISRRFVNMCASGYEVNEEMLTDDFLRYVDFGIHVERMEIDGKIIRYLSELVEYKPADLSTTVFKQYYSPKLKQFIAETGKLSTSFKQRMERKGLEFEFSKEVKLDGKNKVSAKKVL